MKAKRAAIYVRVSTNEQETDMQETELREYVDNRSWSVTVYRDKGQSGAKNDRPALNALLGDMRKRKFDVLIVWSLDRLARSLNQLLSISEECKSVGVDLVSLKQNVDTTLPAGEAHFSGAGSSCRIRARNAPGTSQGWHGTGETRWQASGPSSSASIPSIRY